MKKRADGRYCKQILVGYLPNGKRKMKTIYGRTIKEIEKKERELRQQIDDGIIISSKVDNLIFETWATEWLRTYKLGSVENATYAMYENAINTYLIPEFGNILLKDLKTIQIQKLLNRIIADDKIRTAEICKLTMKQIIQQAIYNRLLNYDITIGLQLIKKQHNTKRALTEFEKNAIECATLSGKQKLFLDIMRYAGLRRGEALALTVEDIDFINSNIVINKSLEFIKNEYRLKSPKSNSSIRNVPIPQILKEELYDYINSLKGEKLFCALKSKDYMTKSSFRKFWDGIIKTIISASHSIKAEKYDNCTISFTPHICRHTYATDIYYAGVDVKTAQYLLGHSSINITLDIYTHLDKKKTNDSINKIDEYLSQSKISQLNKLECNNEKEKTPETA